MRIFLIGSSGSEIKNLMSMIKDHGHKIVYWVGPLADEKDRPTECVFHDFHDALDCLPAGGVDVSDFFPPGKGLIEKMYKTESLILTMMNKHYSKMSLDERRHFYYNLLQYWHGVIRKFKPDLIIFPIIPHTVFNYLIYELARLLGIKTIMFEDTWVSDRLLSYADFWEGSHKLHEEIKKNKDKNFLLTDLSSDLQEYYKLHTDERRDATPPCMKEWRKKYSIINYILLKVKIVIKSLKDFTIFKKIPFYFFKYFKQNIRKEYAGVKTEPDFSKKFIYAPLNYQPERTSSPQGDMFVDQILMIEILSAALPENWVIYVKEHPNQWLSTGLNFTGSRYQGYYKRLARIKNVKLIPIEVDTYALINKSQAVATVTGTAAWEGILRLKPGIIFGYPWYLNCPGIFRVDSVESCQGALNKIISGFNFEQQQVINYLKSFDEATIHGYVEGGIGRNSRLTKEENIGNINKLIALEINKIS